MGLGEVEGVGDAPCLLEVSGTEGLDGMGSGFAREMPNEVNAEVIGNSFFEVGVRSGQDIEDSARNIRGFENAHEFDSGEGVGLTGHGDDSVTHADDGESCREESEEGGFVRGKCCGDADGFIASVYEGAHRGLVDGSVVFVRPGGVVENQVQAGLEFFGGDSGIGELGSGSLKIFGDVVKDLGFEELGGCGPGCLGCCRGFDGVAKIFPVGEGELVPVSGERISTIWSNLFATNVKLVGAIYFWFLN